jgi:hypothetical protein
VLRDLRASVQVCLSPIIVRVARYDRKIRGCKAKVTSSTSRKDRPAAIFHVLAVTFKQIVGIGP